MSYISNGCNDCSSVDFGNNMMGNTNNMMGGNMMGGNMFETNNNGNQFTFQGPPQQMPQQMPQQVQTMQQAPMPQPPKQQMMVQQAPVKMPQQQMVVAKPQQQLLQTQQQSGTMTGVLGNYFYDNAFTITLAFLVASAWHTTIKYYIDHAIKFSGGTPVYYVGYAVLVTVAAIFLTTLKH